MHALDLCSHNCICFSMSSWASLISNGDAKGLLIFDQIISSESIQQLGDGNFDKAFP